MNDYAARRMPTGAPKKRRVILFLLLVGIITFCVWSTLSNQFKTKTDSSTLSPLAVATPTPMSQDSELGSVVQNALAGTEGSYGIVIQNLTSGDGYNLNEHTIYKSGSLYKLWVMAAVYKKIQDGSLKKDQILTESYAKLNTLFQIDPDYAEKIDGTLSLSVADALNQMITISDNYAALLLTERINLSSVANFLRDNGLVQSHVGANGNDPTTTAYDIALFLNRLYNGHFANALYTQEMLDLLKSQRLNSKLPKYLPDSVVVAHKTGELDSYTHDVGIVYAPKSNYIIVVLSNSTDTDAAAERISEVSKDVFNYFSEDATISPEE
ncbi:MAG TPA: serine hydrolase [Candidatus Eisenbacteria bacterium]|nr:serine hydrolase [Candidatus Eisenbacteria bacterium]